MPLAPDTAPPARVLVFAAHPDDIDFGASATIAGWTAAGAHVSYCILTDGDAGGFSDEDRPGLAALRREEQIAAAGLVGVTDVTFLGEPDGYLQPTDGVLREIVRRMREVRPDVVLSMHPERSWDRIQKSHPDHLACGEAVTRAIYPAVENPFAYPELEAAGLRSFRVPWLWFYGGPAHLENRFVDVTGSEDTKIAAISAHRSQHPDVGRMQSRVRDILRENARRGGLPEGRSAESFHVVGINTDETIAGF
ncbi:PIG-L domain-containing protein [Arthrobacter pityocampae]|uniref:PIG-L domain-containing protein n=1 Tax=Arthrobacter pityocampae TaxID=547334 RepID=A0A2S5J242_9MICC|nr:PIG-L deacetylase family protein [Arthrobacter pityocampae]PPB50820.1 PIG-L domain-containing protein [Arthrobacter pityocampae]